MILPIPIGDEPNPPQTAWVTYGLIALNVAVYALVTLPQEIRSPSPSDPTLLAYAAAMARATHAPIELIIREASAYDLSVFRWGFRPSAPSLLTLVTSQFMHAGLAHLGGNMLFLYIFGDNVEAFLGRKRFFVTYIATGIVATLFYALARNQSELPLIGASGAISGILGCYYVWFAFNRVRILLIIFIFITTITVPARTMLLFYIVVENLLPYLLQHASRGGVAYGAHIGGFIAGAAYAQLGAHPLRSKVRQGRAPEPNPSDGRAILERERVLRTEPLSDALVVYDKLTVAESMALPFATLFVFVDRLTERELYDEAIRILRRMLTAYPHDARDVGGRAHIRLGLLEWRVRGRFDAARTHFEEALRQSNDALVIKTAKDALFALNNT